MERTMVKCPKCGRYFFDVGSVQDLVIKCPDCKHFFKIEGPEGHINCTDYKKNKKKR